jgi:very-short-patch-repair endonuclease
MSLLARLPAHEAMRLADRALQRGWIDRSDLIERLRRYPKRYGNTQLRRLLDATADGAAAESERRLHRILNTAGICGWRANYPVWVSGELIAVVDVAMPEHRIALEVDGLAYHVDVDVFRHDRRRQNALLSLGWRVIRFTWADLTERPDYVLNVVRHVLAQPNLGSISPA